ncbi:ectoine/hydroxyectoine ABC transporter permease subunit EhuC [Amycolatopsis sp. WAC 01375]|uniref:ectoine/hydroxyectoine ABC transporter permease subunit EhuC n=1 Tax=unclassified Amycolatopsis TaxID=2618356 RepID=UPI000F79320D|nr:MULTISPECIES: ectoine/hydroxyectoine ABC transporter permease subunit EhuC [unclassified Amycolatopsis]RSM78824.1 ectoine/hydroxyectoine ABC transporter permease subunit EhuC [Amycolatopsis sp. WAC 01375]RSN32283.1 ectoine/hydroxyectoine ABC transporter permease subunit EhuC [Amycolatopsis sp. WAC 01416]
MSSSVSHIITTVLSGLTATVTAAFGGIALTVVLSLVAGLALRSPSRLVRGISRVYVEIFRGTSEVVQLFWLYFVLPVLVGFQLVPMFAGILVLGLNHGAYGAEIVRGAVNSVPRAQFEGAIALNLTPAQRMRRVILPQAFAEMLPPFNNLFIQLLKSTALLSFIAVPEMARQGELLRPVFGSEIGWIYGTELVLYLLIALLITSGMRALERVAARRLGRAPSKMTAAAGGI